jgi:anaerobic selenocysteine-containing dehydrogenase
MNAPKDGTYFRACNLCEAICGLAITVTDGRVSDLRGDPDDPLSHGHICPKGSALQDLLNDPDRLKRPLIRENGVHREATWDEAFAFAGARLKAIVAEYGDDAIAFYLGNPAVHNSGTTMTMGGFTKAIKTRNRFSATSVDQLPHHLAAVEMFGHPLLLPIPDVDRTQYFLVMGANPLVSNGSIMTAPGMRERMRAIQARGGKIVVIDPRRTETANAADEHHFVRPGTDAALLLAFINTIVEDGAANLGRLEAFSDGFETLRDVARALTPERVAAHTGIEAPTIRRIAREFAGAQSAVAYGRVGLSTQAFGGLCQWLVNVLNAITANLDEPGGAMWPLPAVDMTLGAKPGAKYAGRTLSRVRNLPEFDGEYPVATLADEMLAPGPGQVRAFVTIAGNPVLSTPEGARLDDALSKLDFMLSIDPYLNETTRHADVILPPAVGLETDHYDVIFHHFAVRNTARYSEAIFPIGDDQRYDWQIFEGLRFALTGAPSIHPKQRLDQALAYGPRATNLDELREHPHGVDYGPMTQAFPERLLTIDKRVNLAPKLFLDDVARLARAMNDAVPELVLIGRRQLRSNNSWMHNAPRLMRGADRCTLLVNARDAEKYGIAGGDRVELRSRAGAIVVSAEISGDIMPGVVSLPHGFGHDKEGTRLGIASQHAGVSLNDITDAQFLDELCGNAAFSGIPVELRVLALTDR